MRKGIILSVENHFVTLLTPEGEFLKAKEPESIYQVGEEISFEPVVPIKHRLQYFLQFSLSKNCLAVILVIILLACSMLPGIANHQVFAYVTIDINPSIELEVDDQLKVVNMSAYNDEGELVIGKLMDSNNMDITVLSQQILQISEELGYVEKKQLIIVSATVLEENKNLNKRLDSKLKEIMSEKTEIKLIKATEDDRKKAQKEGVSTGIYVEKQSQEEPANTTDEESGILKHTEPKTIEEEADSLVEENSEAKVSETKEKDEGSSPTIPPEGPTGTSKVEEVVKQPISPENDAFLKSPKTAKQVEKKESSKEEPFNNNTKSVQKHSHIANPQNEDKIKPSENSKRNDKNTEEGHRPEKSESSE